MKKRKRTIKHVEHNEILEREEIIERRHQVVLDLKEELALIQINDKMSIDERMRALDRQFELRELIKRVRQNRDRMKATVKNIKKRAKEESLGLLC